MTKEIKVLFDGTIFAMALQNNSSRTGIYMCAKNVLLSLAKNQDCNVSLYFINTYEKLFFIAVWQDCNDFTFINCPQKITVFDKILFWGATVKIKLRKKKATRFLRGFLTLFFSFFSFLNIFIPRDSTFLENNDVFFSPMFKIPPEIKRYKKLKKIMILYDITPILFPQYFSHINRKYWFFSFIREITSEDYFFAISENTKRDFIRSVSTIDSDKIFVTHLAADNSFYCDSDTEKHLKIREKYNIPSDKKYLFSLCSLEPRKNLILAVASFIEFIKKHGVTNFVYVLSGTAWRGFLDKMGTSIPCFDSYREFIITTGYVADEDVASLYSFSEFFVYTSEYEGFGLPVLEAMQCGKAVITSNNSSLPEIVGEAGILIDYDSMEQHISAYEKLYFDHDFRKEQEKKALLRAASFSWTKTTAGMVSVMKKIIKSA